MGSGRQVGREFERCAKGPIAHLELICGWRVSTSHDILRDRITFGCLLQPVALSLWTWKGRSLIWTVLQILALVGLALVALASITVTVRLLRKSDRSIQDLMKLQKVAGLASEEEDFDDALRNRDYEIAMAELKSARRHRESIGPQSRITTTGSTKRLLEHH